jgi:hypothetical protein
VAVRRAWLLVPLILPLACCGGSKDTSGPTAASAAACSLPSTGDLIVRRTVPRLPVSALVVSDVDTVHCRSTVDTLSATPLGSGYCTQVAKEADNPGYRTAARPAAPLRNVILQVGAGC